MILLIDNYDSFTYNLVQRIGEVLLVNGHTPEQAEAKLRVVRNDKITVEQAVDLNPETVIISPGPCTPNEAGVSCGVAEAFLGKVPLFGVCLGHQSIGQAFGMTVARNSKVMHGKTSPIHHDGLGVFAGMSNPFVATRYHSLVVTPESVDKERFIVSAWTEEGEVMALRAKPEHFGAAPAESVQFHPESFLTTEGHRLLANVLRLPNVPEPRDAVA
ncbi:anthranilate synthase component II [Mucisphaera calidilacus]|uniref:Anthranilate synthase component 2 n=1 Tax=Mucisphaera calidilacus TaxID=2527982 RepID=A0A518BZG3_9BACT|nr:aminodeoxychorismate/anthranilate synthase component II [Mucisphaera calidilacus]QDU72351.1 Anthranilate synthase component 2 [Mucisphaera calidilacus]